MPATPLQEQEWICNEACPDVFDLPAGQHGIQYITRWMKLERRGSAINTNGENLGLAMESGGGDRSRHYALLLLRTVSRLLKQRQQRYHNHYVEGNHLL